MRKLTCTNTECKARVPFEPRQLGERIACPTCRQELLLPAPGAQEPTATELGRPLALPLAATGLVVGVIVMSLALGGATATGRVPTYAQGKFVRHDAQKKDKDETGDGRGTGEAGAAAGQLVALPTGGRRLALLVGVRDYTGPLRPLRYTEADVVEFDRVLKQAGYETTLMTGKDATADNVRARFESIVNGCGPSDLLVVAFAGHGIEKNGKFFYCPANARPEVPATLVSINDVFDKLATCKAGSKFVFTDACRNDPNPDQRAGTLKVESLDDNYRVVGGVELQVKPSGNVQAFYSCSPGEYSYEPEAYKHGVFFFYLIRAFQGEGDLDRDGKITFPEVQLYVSKNVTSWGLNNRRVQRPNAKGDVNTLTPLAAWTTGSSAEFAGEAALRDEPSTLLYENFRNVRANLPAGWTGPAFQVATDEKSKRAALQTTKSAGSHAIRLPLRQARVTGDFSLKLDFELGYVGFEQPQVLEVRFLGQQGTVIPVTVNAAGQVTVAGTDPQTTGQFKKRGLNTLEVVRDGEVYVARVNGAKVTSTQPGYSGPVEEIWLSLRAGASGSEPKAKVFQASLHALPSADGGGPSADVPTEVVVRETFDQSARGSSLPQGWAGADFQVATDDANQRACLQKNRPGLGFVTLPPVNLPGDFAVEVEYALSWLGFEHPHVLHIRAEGDAGAADMYLDTRGHRSLFGHTAEDRARRMQDHAVHRVRVVRRAGVYQLYLDDSRDPVAPANHPNFVVKKIQLGLVGGTAGQHPPARIYGVRVSALGPGGGGAAPNWARRNFVAATRGAAPANWDLRPPNSLSVNLDDHSGWVELAPNVPAGDGMTDLQIPPGDFTLTALAHVRRGSDDAVVVGWAEGKKFLNFTLNGHGRYWAVVKPKEAPKLELPNAPVDKIEIQRSRGAVVVRVNGQQLGGPLPVEVPTGRFLVGLSRGNAADKSPRIYSLELTVP